MQSACFRQSKSMITTTQFSMTQVVVTLSQDTMQRLGSCVIQQTECSITLGGVGGIKTQSPHGIYTVKLPLSDGMDVMMTGVCMDQIKGEFPIYPLTGKVEEDIQCGYHESSGKLQRLPNLPMCVVGNTDFTLGIKYLQYFPEKIFQLPSGLTIYKSYFRNVDGSLGVIGGPHKIFTEIEQRHH